MTTTKMEKATLPAALPLPEIIPQPTFVKTEMPNGMPLYIIRHQSAFNEIEANEECPPVYFVLASVKRDNGETTILKKEEWETATIFKRTARSAVGDGLIEMRTSDHLGLAVLKDLAYWKLPSMPRVLVDKIDGFFRAVYKKFHSESIVMLTYDPLYLDSENSSDGWGVLVPVQENSGASCDYKPESVADEKPEHVDIVGTAHSHPEMSAYASHTDVKDQIDFNGLHATAGWQTRKGNETEWHVEYQLDNQRFEFNPKDVFETDDEPEFEDTDDWLDKVTKFVAPIKPQGGYMGGLPGMSGGGGSKPSSPSPQNQYNAHFREKHNSARPNGCPDLVKNTVVLRLLHDKEVNCPVCKAEFGKMSLINRRCTTCFTYVLLPDEEIGAILIERRKHYNDVPYVPGLEFLINKEGACPVMLWERDPDPKVKSTMEALWTPTMGKSQGTNKK